MMSRARLISRRKLLKISSVAPLSALLISGTATDEAIAAETQSFPEDIVNRLWLKVEDEKVPNRDQASFKKAVRILAAYFLHGASDKKIDVPEDKYELMFVDVAYEQRSGAAPASPKSGALIGARTKNWDNLLYESTACAYNCGAEFAIAGPDFSIEPDVRAKYAGAYNKVRDHMHDLLERARAAGREVPDDRPGGAGC
jgi:hypothetical protein